MNAHSPIPLKVRRIVPLLDSPADGEALGACCALKRTLDAVNLDLQDLAAAIPVQGDELPKNYRRRKKHGSAPRAQRPEQERSGPRSYGDRRETWVKYHHRRHFTPRQEAAQLRQVSFFLRNLERLGRRERVIIQSIARSTTGLSFAQADWLAGITDRLDSEACSA